MTTSTPPPSRSAFVARRAAVAALILIVAGLAAACGGRHEAAGLVPPREAIDGIAHRRCEYLGRQPLPRDLDELTRPGTRGSILLWGQGASPADTVELSVRYGSGGNLTWVRPIRNTAPAGRAAELERILLAALPDEGGGGWGYRLRFVDGSLDRVLPSVVCPAERTGAVPRVLPPAGTRQEMREAFAVRRGTVTVEAALDDRGRVVGVRVPHSTGSRIMDQYAMETVRAMTFRPELFDGVPVASITLVRLQIQR